MAGDYFMQVWLHGIFTSTRRDLKKSRSERMEVARTLPDLAEQQKTIQGTAKEGDVDGVEKQLLGFIEKVTGSEYRLLDSEGRELTVEAKMYKQLSTIVHNTQKLKELLGKSKEPICQKLAKEIIALDEQLLQLAQKSKTELREEFLLLESEATEKEQILKMATFNPESEMQSFRSQFRQREEIKKQNQLSQDLIAAEARMLQHLAALAIEDQSQHEAIIQNLKQDEDWIITIFSRYKRLIEQLIEEFNLVIKVSIQTYFQIKHEGEDFLQSFLTTLKDSEYPENELVKIQKAMNEEEGSVHQKVISIMNATRYLGRHSNIVAAAA